MRCRDDEMDDRVDGLEWIRILYAYPIHFTDELIDTLAGAEHIVPYLDLPLQHINDEILTSMRRRVSRKEVETLLNKLRKWVPGIAIRTTFISGTPGETDEQHKELVKFVRDFGFDMMGVFPYSREPGTPMARMGEVDEVASAVLFLASDAASLMTGSIVLVDGGYVCW